MVSFPVQQIVGAIKIETGIPLSDYP